MNIAPFNFYEYASQNLQNGQMWPELFKSYMEQLGISDTYTNSKRVAPYFETQISTPNTQTTVNLWDRTFPQSEHFLLLGIAFFDATNAVPNESDWVRGISNANAKNGTFRITSNGQLKMAETPFVTVLPSTDSEPFAGNLPMGRAIFMQAQENNLIQGTFEPAIGVATYNILTMVYGIKLI
jgi:hypothetical protein